jgi:hypothetical protein
MKLKSVVLSVVAALLVSLFAYHYVYRHIEKLRFKLLEAPAAPTRNGVVSFRFLNPRPYEARIIAARINNNSDQSQTFAIQLNETKLSSNTIKPNSTETHLVYVPDTAICVRCKFIVSSDHSEWELQTVEVRNMFGFSSDWIKAVLVKDDFKSFIKFQPLELLLIFLLTFLVAIKMENAPRSKLWLIPAIIIFAALITLAILPFISNYKVLLSPTTFAKLWIVLFIPVWIELYRTHSARPYFKPVLISLIVLVMLTGGMLNHLSYHKGNFSGFLHISRKFLGRNFIVGQHPDVRRELIKVDGNGYDGQWFYFIAWDPLMKEYHFAPGVEKIIDDPVFRYRRITYPILTKIFSFDQPYLYPMVMIFLLIASGAILGFLISRIATLNGWSPWSGLLALAIPALWFSISVGTPEPLAAAFVAAGFFLTLKKRYVSAAFFFAMAALTRESTILFIVAIALFEFFKNRKFQAPLILIASIVPYFVWRLFVAITLYAMHGWKGFFSEPGNVGIPFMGVIEAYRQIMNGSYIGAVTGPAIALPIVLICMVAAFVLVYRQTKHPVAIIGAIYAFLALCLSWTKVWRDVSNVERQSYESFLCLALLFASRPADNKGRNVIYACVALVLIYVTFFMIRTDMLYAGLIWLLKV